MTKAVADGGSAPPQAQDLSVRYVRALDKPDGHIRELTHISGNPMQAA